MKHLIFVALYATIAFVLEIISGVLPNVALTPVLFAAYFKTGKHPILLIATFLILELLQYGFGFWLFGMMLGYFIWYVIVKLSDGFATVMLSVPFAYLYGLAFLPLTWFIYRIDPIAYIIADFPFATMMAMSNLITMAVLYKPLTRLLGGEYGEIHRGRH